MLFALMNSATVWPGEDSEVGSAFFEVDVADDFDDDDELLLDDVAVLVSDPQPVNTTAKAMTAAAPPVNADVLISLLLLSGVIAAKRSSQATARSGSRSTHLLSEKCLRCVRIVDVCPIRSRWLPGARPTVGSWTFASNPQ